MTGALDLFFRGHGTTAPVGTGGRLDLFFLGSGKPPAAAAVGRVDLFFTGGSGYPAAPTGVDETEYIPTYRPRRR